MKSKNITRQLYFLPALLSLWLIITSACLAWLDNNNFLIAVLFSVLICGLCLSYHLRFIGWGLAIIGSALYFGMHFSLSGVTGNEIRLVSLGVVSLLGTAVLCTFTAEQFNDISTQIQYNRRMIEELRIIDPVSGLIRFHYARKNLSTETARSRRYGKNLCMIIARVADWNEIVDRKGPDASQHIMAQVGDQFRNTIRNTDIATINIEKIGVILPETRVDGAVRVAHRLLENCSSKVKVGLNIGIACFPDDAKEDSDLIRNGEAALQISMSSGLPIVLYSQIKGELDPETLVDSTGKMNLPIHTEKVDTDHFNYRRVEEKLPNEPGELSQTVMHPTMKMDLPSDFLTPDVPDYLSENQNRVQDQEHRRSKMTDWVEPYSSPVVNLELESKVQYEAESEFSPVKAKEILVGIKGIEDIDEIHMIENAFRNLPFIKSAVVVDFLDKTLIINLSHNSKNIIKMLNEELQLPFHNIHEGEEWIEISMKKE